METELKLQVAEPKCWQAILDFLPTLDGGGEIQSGRFRAIYYDTPKGSLRKARMALRIRQENGSWMATLKGGGTSLGGLHQRQEWNVPLPRKQAPAVALFEDEEAAALLKAALQAEEQDLSWQALLETDFERTFLRVDLPDGSCVEIAADKGKILAAGRRAAILELELELVSGQETALFSLGEELARRFPLLPASGSKFHRGLLLAGLAEANEEISPSCAAGTRLAMLHWLRTAIYWQEQFLQRPEEVRPVYQLRVALRRMRSVLSFCRPFLEAEACRHYQEELRHWGEQLAGVRETDVLLATLAASGLDAGSGVLGELETDLAARRQVLAEDVARELAKGWSTPLVLALWQWLLSPDWAVEPTASELTERLSKWLIKLRKVGDAADLALQDELHDWRIQGKKVRYAFEFCLLQRLRLAPEMIETLVEIQDALGELHDIQVQHQLLMQWRDVPGTAWEAGFLDGWQEHERRRMLPDLKKLRKDFRRYVRRWLREHAG